MIRAIVTDIEGTTSSLSFVKDVLFPYARRHLADFVLQHKHEPQVHQLLNDSKQAAGDSSLSDEAIVETLIQWIDNDQKVTPLKSLQGLIWEHGYQNGDYTGHIYDDAVANLRRWHEVGIKLYVYSSGSVYAQKLLFSHSDHGDLTPLFSGYFDTHIGHKREAEAYRNISQAIGLPAAEILFLSDIEGELDAAHAAGMHTCWLVRDVEVDASATHQQAGDFNSIALDSICTSN